MRPFGRRGLVVGSGLVTVIAIAVLGACGPPAPIPESKSGTLGNGTFAYGCVNANDTFCPVPPTCANPTEFICTAGFDESTPSFPSAIALNAPFALAYSSTVQGSVGAAPLVVAVSSAFFATSTTASPYFTALRPGTSWFYTVQGDIVFDLTSVTVEPIASLRVTDSSGSTGPFTETLGANDTFTAAPAAADGTALAGAVTYTWSLSNTNVMTYVAASGQGSITPTFLAPGTVTVSVAAQNVQSSFTVTVTAQ